MMADLGQEIGWDDEIENEGADFEPLPEGTYEFEVRTMQRGRFPGSDKMCACNTAELTLVIVDNDGKEHQIFESLKLNSKMEWLLSQFFLCIGQKKKGEALRPNWNAVPGSRGMAEITVNEYKDKNGNLKKNNRVSKYLAPEPKQFKAGVF